MTATCLASPAIITSTTTQCAHCNQPFPLVNGRVQAWRSSIGGFFCNEFCAEDDEEAVVRVRGLPSAERPLVHELRGWGALHS